MRSEQEIFDDLARLCISPGYVHAIAHLCFRDNVVGYTRELTPEDTAHLFSKERLIRSEIATLIGLLVKAELDYTLPTATNMQQYLDTTGALLEELHHALPAPSFDHLSVPETAQPALNPFASGEMLREPIFYAGESAYSFQYRDLSPRKYAKDVQWFEENKGFSIIEARDVVHAIERVQNEKFGTIGQTLAKLPPEEWTVLPAFAFTINEIADTSRVEAATVENVLTAFAIPALEHNLTFRGLQDFNVANASPLLRASSDSFILFQQYSLAEALYEAPFYWMCSDASYAPVALRHRGLFAEEFSKERLEFVFGKGKVYANVNVLETKGDAVGEIDVLVVFGNRAILLQAKSKRLTIEARKGNDGRIKDDFKKSIQDSYDQGFTCAKALTDSNYKFVDADSTEIRIPSKLKQVYLLSVLSDHYPALSFQAYQFLKFETTEIIRPPFVADLFTLDAMTEMLGSPLHLLSYIDRRTGYSNRVLATHESICLAYHLKQNLWLDNETDLFMLSDDMSVELDIAMAVRRDNVPGKRVPDGILTRYAGTAMGRLIEEIEERSDPGTIDLGLMLLAFSSAATLSINKNLENIREQAARDGKGHDLTVIFQAPNFGLIIHCNNDPISGRFPELS